MDLVAQGDFGPHTQVKLTEWIENVPVKDIDGRIIGRAKVSDTGVIHAVVDEKLMSKELFDLLRTGIGDALSIETLSTPEEPKIEVSYTEEVRRRFDAANAPHKEEKP